MRGLNKKPTTVVSRGFLLKLGLASTRASGIADDNDDVQNDNLQSIFQHNENNLLQQCQGVKPAIPPFHTLEIWRLWPVSRAFRPWLGEILWPHEVL